MTVQHLLAGLAVNPALPDALLDQLVTLADDDLARELAFRPHLGRARAALLAERSEGASIFLAQTDALDPADVDPVSQPQAALALLHAGTGPPEWAVRFAADPVPERREQLAGCPGLPPEVEATLAADPHLPVVVELALWTRTAELLARLAAHPCIDVRSAVADNWATPPAVLAALATGAGLPPATYCLTCATGPVAGVADFARAHAEAVAWMRDRLAGNPATPVEAVAGLVDDPSMTVRSTLARRRDLPPAVCRRLAEDPMPGVRAVLAGNPVIGVDLIRQLATCRMYDVQRSLAHHPDVPLDVLTYLAGRTKIGPNLLPRIAAATPAEIEQLAASAEPVIRMLVAHHPRLPAAARDRLAADADAKVLKSIAADPGLTEDQLRDLVARHGIRVLVKVATNPGATAALLTDLVHHLPPVQKVFRTVARHPHATAPALVRCLDDFDARSIAARHPALPPELIVELLDDPRGDVAEAAAANPALPVTVMTALARVS